jgi:integrase
MSRSKSAAPQRDEKSGTWWFVVDLSPGPDGQRRQAKRRGFRTKADALEAMDNLRVSGRNQTYVAPKRQTLADYLRDDWLPAIRSTIEPSTWESYDRYMRLHVMPHIGGVQLQQLDAGHLNRLYAELLATGRLDGKDGGLKPRTVRYIHTIIGRALREAVAWGRIQRSPAQAATPPGASQAKPPEMRTWDGPTLARFLELSREDRHHAAWFFLATSGCRRGEALGLRWADVDLDGARATIRQTVTAVGHEVLVQPRTKRGKPRPIELDAATITVLRTWRTRQLQERLSMGAGFADQGLVFAQLDGQPLHPEHFTNAFDRRVARFKVPRIRLHDLRHTWATLALEAGIDVKIVSERLGHASATITWNTYQHVSPAMQAGAAEKVAGLIFGGIV